MDGLQLYIKSSNSLDSLVDKLTETISESAGNVFLPVHIVTQTDGMCSWLKMRIAEKSGIAANLLFFKPNELISKIYWAGGGQYEKTLLATDIQWLIYKTLKDKEIIERYPVLVAYYQGDREPDNIKRIALARELADLFDQYQVYRVDMLKKWEQNELATSAEEEKWQRDIWLKIKAAAGDQFPDKGSIRDAIVRNLEDGSKRNLLQQKIPGVHFFGTSLITSFHYDILQAVSAYLPITIFLPNPAPQLYWYEDKSRKALFYEKRKEMADNDEPVSNPLLVNWGKLIRDTFLLFFKNDDAINHYEDIVAPISCHSLLSGVQNLIHNNEPAGTGHLFSDDVLSDGSLTIKSCFSPAREVEALYNYLVKLIDSNPGKYSTRDIVVHVTDIDRYASYIRSVFDNVPDKLKLKYTIADESYTMSDTVSQALYEILTLEENDFTSERVVQLLNFSSIRKHFGITDISLIRKAINDANIRFGIEGKTSDDSVYVSWQYGLKRIMYGICMHTTDEYGEGESGFFPLNNLESSDANEAARFVYMVQRMTGLLRDRKTGRTVNEWVEFIHDVLRQLVFDEEERDNREYQVLIEKINELTTGESLFNENISFEVFLQQFLPVLNDGKQSYKFARGGITFCSLIPMRSIPFKVVAMLGLDFDKFPRKPVMPGFDLMKKFPRIGDRNIKMNDKHLFLETLMSAGDRLYLSYVGQRIIDNTKRPPSILVDELMTFIESASTNPGSVRKMLLMEEPLHGFSPKYGNEDGYFNYLISADNKVRIEKEDDPEKDEIKSIDLLDVYNFFSDSVKYYYRKQIGIDLDDDTVVLPETEKFELNNLEKWLLKIELLTDNTGNISSIIDKHKKTGLIPLKSGGEYAVTEAMEELVTTKMLFDEERGETEISKENIEIVLDGIILTATLDFVFGDKVLIPDLSANPNKRFLYAWLVSLVVAASGIQKDVIYIGAMKKEAIGISRDEAIKKLYALLKLMQTGTGELLLFNVKWFEFSKTPTEADLEKKLKAEAGNDQYLSLALADGLDERLAEKYFQVADEIVPAINATF